MFTHFKHCLSVWLKVPILWLMKCVGGSLTHTKHEIILTILVNTHSHDRRVHKHTYHILTVKLYRAPILTTIGVFGYFIIQVPVLKWKFAWPLRGYGEFSHRQRSSSYGIVATVNRIPRWWKTARVTRSSKCNCAFANAFYNQTTEN